MSDSDRETTDDTDEPDHTVAVYSDYVCPFCYLGKESLDQYREETDDSPDVEWRPFDLRRHKRRPDGTIADDIEDGKDEDYYDQVRENVARLRDRYDVEMVDFDDVPDDVDSWNAQLVALGVRRTADEETFRELDDALFEALWTAARDIGDPDVLRDVLDSVGLDSRLVDETLDDEELEADLEGRFAEAKSAGVTGVPTFVYDGYAARGAVPPAQLRRLVEGT